jgi:hypothetical protein
VQPANAVPSTPARPSPRAFVQLTCSAHASRDAPCHYHSAAVPCDMPEKPSVLHAGPAQATRLAPRRSASSTSAACCASRSSRRGRAAGVRDRARRPPRAGAAHRPRASRARAAGRGRCARRQGQPAVSAALRAGMMLHAGGPHQQEAVPARASSRAAAGLAGVLPVPFCSRPWCRPCRRKAGRVVDEITVREGRWRTLAACGLGKGARVGFTRTTRVITC